MYENSQVHIPVINNCPKFRPVSSAIGAPTNKLAKFLVPILRPLTVNEFPLAEEVYTLCPDYFMASLDVESLFTDISLNRLSTFVLMIFCDTNTIHNLYRHGF